jgi:hypothetical protein
MLAVTVTSRDQCLAVVRWLAVGGCRRRYRYLPTPAVAAASRHRYHRYRICAGNSFTPSKKARLTVDMVQFMAVSFAADEGFYATLMAVLLEATGYKFLSSCKGAKSSRQGRSIKPRLCVRVSRLPPTINHPSNPKQDHTAASLKARAKTSYPDDKPLAAPCCCCCSCFFFLSLRSQPAGR